MTSIHAKHQLVAESVYICFESNSGAYLIRIDPHDQPNLYFWVKISQWANLVNFHPIWFKFGVVVIYTMFILKCNKVGTGQWLAAFESRLRVRFAQWSESSTVSRPVPSEIDKKGVLYIFIL